MSGFNDESNNSNFLQSQFTAYLVVAVRNRRIQYKRLKARRKLFEEAVEIEEYQDVFTNEPDMMAGLPILEQIENRNLQKALSQIKQRELYILFARVLEGRSFGDIAHELDLNYKSVTSIYYRLIQKLKNELRGETK